MKIYITLITIILLLLYLPAITQIPSDFKMVNASIGSSGELVIKASSTSSKDDFNFLAGNWVMENKRLTSRLSQSTEWVAYYSTSQNLGIILNGLGNLDFYRTEYNQVSNAQYEGITLRLFNPATRLWSLYWADSNLGVLDPPVVGSFEGNVGTFYCRDTFQGKPVVVMFLWDKTDPENPVWAQAFSADEGKSWEMNMMNVSHRVSALQ